MPHMVNNNSTKLKLMIIYIYLIIKLFITFRYTTITLVKTSLILVVKSVHVYNEKYEPRAGLGLTIVFVTCFSLYLQL